MVIVAEPWDENGEATWGEIGRLLRMNPLAGLVALSGGGARWEPGTRMLVRVGATEFCFSGVPMWVDDLVDSVGRVYHKGFSTKLLAIVTPRGESPEKARVAAMFAEVLRPGTVVGDVARALQWSRRHLARVARRLELPMPKRFAAFDRLLFAATLLDATNRSVERIALAAGFSSGTSLANATRRYVGASPTSLRRNGATLVVLSALQQLCTGLSVGARLRSG